jgi:hypothetical protein
MYIKGLKTRFFVSFSPYSRHTLKIIQNSQEVRVKIFRTNLRVHDSRRFGNCKKENSLQKSLMSRAEGLGESL